MKKAFFLDRDGVINEEVSYLHEPDKTVLLPKVAEAVKLIHSLGFLAIVVTNQSGVARGYYPESDVHLVHLRLQSILLKNSPESVIDAWYCCCHHPEISGECSCRKPHPGMLLQAAEDFDIDLSRSFMIGDRMSDLNAGKNAGCLQSCLVLSGYGRNELSKAETAGVPAAQDLLGAVKILAKHGKNL